MGISFSANEVINYVTGRKRKLDEFDEGEIRKVIDNVMHTPKRKKLESTTKYIYQALFEEGKSSDITVCAMNQEFHLHKIYLSQSPYFLSMFGGSWVETTKKYVTIDIIDPLINIESLKVVFGSLYNAEITLQPLSVVSILATALMFQLDGLIEKCREVMMETINPQTSLTYYGAACRYGDRKLEEVCFEWFRVNLMTYYFTQPLTDLEKIPIELMEKLVAHPDLFVTHTESSLYIMLTFWIFKITHESYAGKELSHKTVSSYFSSRKGKLPFLLSKKGRKYARTFSSLRLDHMLYQTADIDMIMKDNVIPKTWLNPVILQQWKHTLRVNQNEDRGPQTFDEDYFLRNSIRCGRVLNDKQRHVWRWAGYLFGMDLRMINDGGQLSIKRGSRSDCGQLVCKQSTRNITIRVTVAKLNEQRQIVYLKESGVLNFALTIGEEYELLTVEEELEYPIIISANIQSISPENSSNIQGTDISMMVP